MDDLVMARRIKNLEKSYYDFSPIEKVQFDGTKNDMMNFTFYRWLLLCCSRSSNEVTLDQLEDQYSEYEKLSGTKAVNFVVNNGIDYSWVKTQETFYHYVCENGVGNYVQMVTCNQDILDSLNSNNGN